jgi:RNA polymerase sigma-70 factor (ECF subfamily)
MNDTGAAAHFEAYRPLMFSIAYRMLGSATEAEDVLQEAYLRYQAVTHAEIISPKAYLSTIVTRLCLNQMQSARAQRETYIGPWLPEPVRTDEALAVELHESISIAFLTLLEQLTPPERAIFLLREVFDYEYAEIAHILDREEAACRQIFSRARKHIAESRPRFKPSPETHRQMLNQFITAIGSGELDGLMLLLTDDVTLWADGGGKARGAAIYPVIGREAVARFLMASTRLAQGLSVELAEINGEPAMIVRSMEQVLVVVSVGVENERIGEILVIGNPDKLTWISGGSHEREGGST